MGVGVEYLTAEVLLKAKKGKNYTLRRLRHYPGDGAIPFSMKSLVRLQAKSIAGRSVGRWLALACYLEKNLGRARPRVRGVGLPSWPCAWPGVRTKRR
jgi:hypothetical protein